MSTDAVQPSSAAGHVAGSPTNAATQGAKPANAAVSNANTTVANVGQLQAKAPDVYQGMLKALAFDTIMKMKHHEDDRKEREAENKRNSGG